MRTIRRQQGSACFYFLAHLTTVAYIERKASENCPRKQAAGAAVSRRVGHLIQADVTPPP